MIFTIGHSTHDADAFLHLLTHHRIERLADVRTLPRSRRHPQFDSAALERWLERGRIGYRHFPGLGGFRKPLPDSPNTAWQHPSFRGYADYMATPSFVKALDELLEFATGVRTVVMCAEAAWWQCHRRLLSDALVVRGIAVYHILSVAPPKAHELSEFARVSGSKVTYPGLL